MQSYPADHPYPRPSVSDGDLAGHSTYVSFDGVRIAYRDLGDGPPTLLHHGFASDSRINWLRTGVAGALLESGRRLVLVDARGHGDSDKPHDPGSYGNGVMARDARGLLDHLGITAIDLVGYSMGSLVVIELALSGFPVRSMVLGGIGARPLGVFDPSTNAAIVHALEADDLRSVTDRSGLAVRNFADATGADRLALAAIARAGSSFPTTEELASIRVPTLVVNAERDRLVGRPEALAEIIPGARSVIVPGDHVSAVAKPGFRRLLVEFLAPISDGADGVGSVRDQEARGAGG